MKLVVADLRAQLHHFPQCALLGFVGVALGVFCAAVGAIRGFEIPREGTCSSPRPLILR
jgi:hypothetical protein